MKPVSKQVSTSHPVPLHQQSFGKQVAVTLRWIFHFAGADTWRIFVGVVGQFSAAIVAVIIPLYYKKFFNILASKIPVTHAGRLLIGTLLTILGLALLRWIIERSSVFIVNPAYVRMMERADRDFFSYTISHSSSFFANTFVGALVRKMNRFIRIIQNILGYIIFDFNNLITLIGGIVIVLFIRNFWLGLAATVWIVACFVTEYIFVQVHHPMRVARAEKESQITGHMADSFVNQEAVRSYGRSDYEITTFGEYLVQLKSLRLRAWNTRAINWMIWRFLAIVLEFVLMSVAVWLWLHNRITVGDFALIQSYIVTLLQQTAYISNLMHNFSEDISDGIEAIEIRTTPRSILDPDNPVTLTTEKGTVEFSDVTFHYDHSKALIKNLTLKINGGERIALVGHSGAGKSTLVRLLMRAHDVTKGAILIDGQDIRSVTQDDLHHSIAFVPQDPVLFHRSLMDNIRYGRLDATEKEVIAAAKQAHAHEFISKLEHGYNTLVGERGVKLSGGERQRVAIARAILKNAPILILDEATSSLDSESEQLIQKALHTLMERKTVIAIAHRLSTIMEMDRILVIDAGKVVDQGAHAELIARDGVYKRLWDIQAGGFIAE